VANGAGKNKATIAAEPPKAVLGRTEAVPVVEPANRRVLAVLIADIMALLVAELLAALWLPVLSGAPLVGRVFDDYTRTPFGSLLTVVLIVPWSIFVLYGFGLYRRSARSIGGAGSSEALRGLTAVSVATWSLAVVLLFAQGDDRSLGFLILFWAIATVAVPTARWAARKAVWKGTSYSERTVIVGAGAVGHLLAEKIGKHPEYNVRLVGFLDDGEPVGTSSAPVPVVGHLVDLDRVIDEYQIKRVIIAFSRARHQQILNLVRTCAEHGVRVNIVPRLFEILSSRTGIDDVEGIPLLDVASVEMGRFNTMVKRIFDVIVGGLFTLIALPLLGLLAVLIKLDSRGPVFFCQERMGHGGKVFRIIKLRSMHAGAEGRRLELASLNEYSGPMFKIKRDPRVTRVGRLLRKWSLDELPQLLNVMKGEMSLVGPRPLRVEEARQCRGWTKKRLDITPGITGLWQVLGRNDIPFDEMVKLDYMYVTGWTLGWDIKILVETVPAVLAKRGAY